jgi:hypothetical protein
MLEGFNVCKSVSEGLRRRACLTRESFQAVLEGCTNIGVSRGELQSDRPHGMDLADLSIIGTMASSSADRLNCSGARQS